MSYAAAVDHLNSLGLELAPPRHQPRVMRRTVPQTLQPARRKFDLAHMRTLAAALGEPQTTFPSVLIAGTNGKGSTSATLASILTAAGYRTGLYTSPHLVRVNERIQIAAHRPPPFPSPTTTSPASTSRSTTRPAARRQPAISPTRPASSKSSPPSPSSTLPSRKSTSPSSKWAWAAV